MHSRTYSLLNLEKNPSMSESKEDEVCFQFVYETFYNLVSSESSLSTVNFRYEPKEVMMKGCNELQEA